MIPYLSFVASTNILKANNIFGKCSLVSSQRKVQVQCLSLQANSLNKAISFDTQTGNARMVQHGLLGKCLHVVRKTKTPSLVKQVNSLEILNSALELVVPHDQENTSHNRRIQQCISLLNNRRHCSSH